MFGIFIIPVILRFFDDLLIHYSPTARWFKLHLVSNAMICLLSYKEMNEVFDDPMRGSELSTNIYSVWIGYWLHVYHMVYFKTTRIDKLHHFFSVFVCLPIAYMLQIKLLSFHYFIACGFPGLLDYFLLILVKHKKISYLTEKEWNSDINAFVRMPFGVIASYITYLTVDYSPYLWYMCIASFLNFTIFGKIAIENYITHKTVKELAE